MEKLRTALFILAWVLYLASFLLPSVELRQAVEVPYTEKSEIVRGWGVILLMPFDVFLRLNAVWYHGPFPFLYSLFLMSGNFLMSGAPFLWRLETSLPKPVFLLVILAMAAASLPGFGVYFPKLHGLTGEYWIAGVRIGYGFWAAAVELMGLWILWTSRLKRSGAQQSPALSVTEEAL